MNLNWVIVITELSNGAFNNFGTKKSCRNWVLVLTELFVSETQCISEYYCESCRIWAIKRMDIPLTILRVNVKGKNFNC